MTYSVRAWTNVHNDPEGGWIEGLVWQGDSFTRALWEFRKAKNVPLGVYVALRWDDHF